MANPTEELNLAELNEKFRKLQPEQRITELYRIFEHSEVMLTIFEERGGILKFYPLLDVSREQLEAYIKDHLLPFHPLQTKGYFSIGCTHCTKPGKGRKGRWNNSPKTECGLHL